MMVTTYDPDADAYYAHFAPQGTPIVRTDEVAPGVMIDFDRNGQAVGIEVLGVRERSSGLFGQVAKAAAE